MQQWIEDYVKGCTVCQQNKILTHKAKNPLYWIPTTPNAQPFERIAMDLITGLPRKGDKDAILTIVDQGCSWAAIFLPCATTITGPQIAQLYLDHIYWWFGLPTKVISDRDPQFTLHFGTALMKKLGIQQNLSSAFHPQTDRLSKRKNQWVEEYLWIVTSLHPEDWTAWIAIALAVHNNWQNSTIRLSPNQVLLGYKPTLVPMDRIITTNETAESQIEMMIKWRQEAIQALNKVAKELPENLARFWIGDQVWLEATHLRLPFQTSKLNPKRYGPFWIQKVISPVAYWLELPVTWRIHNTFHVSLLSPYQETPKHGLNFSCPPLDLIDGEEEQEIEQILNHRTFGRQWKLQYLIKWKGFPKSDNKWVNPKHMHAPNLIQSYHKRNPLISIKSVHSLPEEIIPLQSTNTTWSLPPSPLISLNLSRMHYVDVVGHDNNEGLKVTDPQWLTTSSLKEKELRSWRGKGEKG